MADVREMTPLQVCKARQQATYARAQALVTYLRQGGITVLGAGDCDAGSTLWIAFADTLGLSRLYRFTLDETAPDILAQLHMAATRAAEDLETETSNFIPWRPAR